jgi:hypothetical protein
MDCRTARQLLDFARPLVPEVGPRDAEALQEHLAGCADCGGLAQAERRIDYHLGQAMRAVPVPEGLDGRLLGRLDAERREASRRRWLRRLAVGGAAAACLVVAVGGALWFRSRPPVLEVGPLAGPAEDISLGPSAERVRASFQRYWGIDTFPPARFDYRQLSDYDVVLVQGRRVPKIVFRRDQSQAWVYVVEDGMFDLRELAADTGGGSVSARTQVLPGDRAGFRYVVVYTGDSLDPFLNKGPAGD